MIKSQVIPKIVERTTITTLCPLDISYSETQKIICIVNLIFQWTTTKVLFVNAFLMKINKCGSNCYLREISKEKKIKELD